MKKMQVFRLVGVLASTAFAVAADTERDVLDNWRNAVSTNDFKKTLVSVRTVQEDWPAVHSVKHPSGRDAEKSLVQKGYRDVARDFLKGLEHYEKELRDMSPEEFCKGANTLLDVRSRFLKHPSYVNYFLADCINRVIYVNLVERLAKVGDVPACYDKIVERLAEIRYGYSQLYELANREYDAKPISRAEVEEMPLHDKVKAIEKMIGQENFVFGTQDMHNSYGLRILEKRSLTALLNRLVVSDHIIGASLPALLVYRRKAANFTPTDSREQIRAVLGEDTLLPPTLTSPEPSSAASMISNLLRGIPSGNLRIILAFSDPPHFTKEYIEYKEKEEAEREAKREAATK